MVDVDPGVRVRILSEALPYIRKFYGKAIVIKLGGRVMEELELKELVVQDLVLLKLVGISPVVVHGGGQEIDRFLNLLGIPVEKKRGRRVTTPEVLEVVEMVLTGKINNDLIRLFLKNGVPAVGLTGIDGGMITASRRDELGLVGEVELVVPDILEVQIEKGLIPVIAPLARSRAGETLNVNADEVSAHIATALRSEKLILLTDVPGVRDGEGWIETMGLEDLRRLLESSAISGGMIPKLECVLYALENGVSAVHILDGTIPHSLLLELFTDHGVGTMIAPGQPLTYRSNNT
jgi:acetylglutamate kinase